VSAAVNQASLLSADDPAAFVSENFGCAYPALLVCDHASNAVPRALAGLGLSDEAIGRHIAWDIGAGLLAQRLGRLLQLPLVSCGYSRLVIDCNRHLSDPSSILTVSDSQAVPGNMNLSDAARRARIAEIFEPYHGAVETTLMRQTCAVIAPALLAVHSFTPVIRGFARPWHCGILWDQDPRIAVPLLEALRRQSGIEVGDNEPYSGRDPADYTVSEHAERRGWPHVCIEVRQDLLQTTAGIDEWAERLATPLAKILANNNIYEVANY
jgi:predicted N-formylglutamate amidohydrolase